jgi:HK97 family phage major capsid protein
MTMFFLNGMLYKVMGVELPGAVGDMAVASQSIVNIFCIALFGLCVVIALAMGAGKDYWNLLKYRHQVNNVSGTLGNGVLLMNDNTLLALYKQCAAQGQSLWLGKDDTFFGYRIVRCASMPDAASGSIPVLFGDFKQVYINNNGDRSIKRLDQLFIANDHIGFQMMERVGIKLTVPDAIKSLKVA